MVHRDRVEIVIAEKLKNLLGVSGATTKGFVGVYHAVQKPQCGPKASVCSYIWPDCIQHGSWLAMEIFIMMYLVGEYIAGRSW